MVKSKCYREASSKGDSFNADSEVATASPAQLPIVSVVVALEPYMSFKGNFSQYAFDLH